MLPLLSRNLLIFPTNILRSKGVAESSSRLSSRMDERRWLIIVPQYHGSNPACFETEELYGEKVEQHAGNGYVLRTCP